MKQKKITLNLFFLLSSIYAFSQEHYPIKGRIENSQKQVVGMATIKIFKGDSKELFDQVYANEDGTFEIPNLEDGTYKLIITEFGYQQFSTIAEVKGGVLDIGNIVLQNTSTDTVQLKGAFVRAQTSKYKNEIDKRVVEVGNDLISAGADAASVLSYIPSVNIDPETGSLSLRGNNNVKIYVDGKPSPLSAEQLLKQIPSNQIQRIEVITNPSAKYEADGKSGIINIVLVKGVKKGYNITMTTGYEQGRRSRFNSSVDTNVNIGKINFFGNLSYSDRISERQGAAKNYSNNIDQIYTFENLSKNLSYKAGIDWFINDKNSLTAYTSQTHYEYTLNVNSVIIRSGTNKNNYNNIFLAPRNSKYNLNYKLDFDKKDHNLVLDALYSVYKISNDNRDYINYYPKDDFYKEYRYNNIATTRVNLDYTNQFKDAGKLEIGVQYRSESNKNDMTSTQSVTTNGVVYNPVINFNFDRYFYSAYANYKQQFNSFGIQVGLRLEDVKDKSNWIYAPNNTAGNLDKTYTNLFPSVFLTYDLTKKAKLSLNYSRRTDRPTVYQLTPVPSYSSPLLSRHGNPNLIPEFTDSYELGYLHELKKGTISANLFFRNVKNNIVQTFIKNPEVESAFIQYDLNYDKVNNYGVEVSWNYKLVKWMNVFLAGDFTSSEIQNYTDKIKANILSFRLNNTYSITKQLSLQQFILFKGRNKNLQGEQLDMWKMDLGLRYKFMDGRASVSAKMNDVFRTMRMRVNVNNPYDGNFVFRWESQFAYLGLTYNFGGKVRSREIAQKNETGNNVQSIL